MARPRKIPDCNDGTALSKRQCILAAAQQVFMEMGYAMASMDAVASRANVSKATIYAYFDGKRALFEHIVRERCQHVSGVADMPSEAVDGRAALRQLATRLLGLILSPEALAMHRVVVAEAPRLPELGEAFYAAGPVPILASIARMLNELTRRGLLSVPEAHAALLAELFLNMLKGDVHTRALLGVPSSHDDHHALLDMAVDLVMTRYAPQSAAKRALNR
jgi:TetR/AcrR family transcriptional repressor of mexJK operon